MYSNIYHSIYIVIYIDYVSLLAPRVSVLLDASEETYQYWQYITYMKHQHKITNFQAVDENIIKINSTLNSKPVTIFRVYAIYDDEPY